MSHRSDPDTARGAEPQPGTLEYWAAQKADEPAIIEGDRILTWAGWNAQANQLAKGLQQHGLGGGDVVASRTQIRAEWAILASAVSKIGARLLLLNWRLTGEEARFMLRDSDARAIVCDDADPSAFRAKVLDLPLRLYVSIDADANGFERWPDLLDLEAPSYVAAADCPLIIYTSGTTGRPKGVEASTRSSAEAIDYLRSIGERRPQTVGEVMLITMPMHHGAGPGLVRSATRAGTPMIFLRRFDPLEVLRLIEKHRVTYWTAVPTMFKRLRDLPEDVLRSFDVSSIRSIGVGTAPMSASLRAWVVDYFGDCLHEGYGTTETGMITAASPEDQRQKPGSCGCPYRQVSIAIRSDDGRSLPPRATGEIWASTPATIRAYLGSGPLDHSVLDDKGRFRTGDIGHLDDEGYLFITDRAKDMIISGGVNIYPAEVEAAISSHPAVRDVAVIGVPDPEFGEQVKAICEMRPGMSVNEEQLRAHLAGTLASYKQPKSIDFVDRLPRSAIGKVMKRELRAPFWAHLEKAI